MKGTKNFYAVKANNYLLRSRRKSSLISVLWEMLRSRVVFDGVNWTVVDAAGEWGANCTWEINALRKAGLVYINAGGKTAWITGEGFACYRAAKGQPTANAVPMSQQGTFCYAERGKWETPGLWMVRLIGKDLVLFCSGVEHSRYTNAVEMFAAFQEYTVPRQEDLEASLSR